MTQAQQHLPVSFFGMAVGTLAWGHAWRAAVQLWSWPEWLATVSGLLGLGVWLGLLLAYSNKWRLQKRHARLELDHPVQSAMASLVPVSTLLAAITLKPLWPEMAWAAYAVGMVVQLVLGLWLVGRLWQGGRAPESINGSTYMPGVAQNFVAATASVVFGFPALGALFFGAGFFSWLALESMVFSRAATQAPLPAAQRPLQGVQVAPPVVGGLSYLALTSGPPDLIAQMMLGYGLYQALLALRLMRWTGQGGFAPTYWTYSFGVMAMATMALRFHQRAPTEALWLWLAAVLFVWANLAMAVLWWRTAALARQGRLLPPLVPAP